MIVISGLLLTLFFGILLSFLVVPTFKPLERIGISYVLGLGVQTFLMFLIYLVVGNYSLFNTLSILIVGNFILLLFSRKRLESFFKDLKSNFTLNNFTLFQKIILGLIAFFVLFSLICTLYWPVSSWDSLVLYDWRAKLFVATGGMEEGIRRGYFFGVPLMTSLAHTWIYFLGGNQPEIIYTLLLLSFILMIYGSIRRYTCITLSLIAVLMITTYPEILIHSTFSYTNFPYMVYFVMSTVYLYLFMNKVDKSYLFPSAILLGLSSWIRTSEPFWIINLIVLLVYSLISKKLWQPVVYISTFFLFRQPWVIYENSRLSYDTTVTGKITEGIQVLLGEVNLLHLQTVVKFLTSNFWSKLDIYLLLFIVFVIWEWTFLRKKVSATQPIRKAVPIIKINIFFIDKSR